MTAAIVKGILAGLAYGLLLGPLFFLGLQVTLKQGLRNGLALALGAFFSDAILAFGGWWSSAWLFSLARGEQFQSAMGVTGALLLIGFGVSAMAPRREKAPAMLYPGTGRRRYSFLKGFAINMANPSNWLFWLGLATAARAEAPTENPHYTLVFIGASLLMVLSTDIAKVLLANQIGRRLRPDLPGKIVRSAGAVLIVLGSGMLIKSLMT
ncbi:MAG: LysE family transporter [Lewinellaceae bacterium]|nr:LysE family transporter [Lewinellaceae bacterium]